MKTYIKHSDTCACVYIQTYDPDTETWGSLERYRAPTGTRYQSTRCAAHRAIAFEDLNTALIDECRARNLAVKYLMANPTLARFRAEELMARCTYEGDGAERKAVLTLPELTRAEKEAEYAAIEARAADENEVITAELAARVELR